MIVAYALLVLLIIGVIVQIVECCADDEWYMH